MDPGEVEVIAQTKKLGLEVVDPAGLISGIDEKRGREIAGKNSIPVMGVLKVLAIMHFQGFLKYFDSVTTLRKHKKRFSDSIIQKVYKETEAEFHSGANSMKGE
jgi:predicted nucleic acid-binding protein